MNRLRRLSLGAKLNLALLAFFLVLGAATLAIIVYGFNRTQDNADARSNEALERGGSLALQAVAGGAAEQGGLLFEAVAEVGQRSSIYVETRAQAGSGVVPPAVEFATSDTGHRYDPNSGRVADLVVINGVSVEDELVQDDIAFSLALESIFPVLLQGFDGQVGGRNLDPIAIVFISTNGVTRYYPPVGIHSRLPSDADFTERMADIGPEGNPERRTIWTAPYEDGAGQGLIVTARTPVYDGQSFRGSIEVDVSMSNVFAQIDGIRPTPRAFAFYVDKEGTLLEGRSFPLLNNEASANQEFAQVLDEMRSISPGDSTTADARLLLASENYYIAYGTVPVLGGTFAVAAPVSDLTAAAASISSGIDDEATRTLQVMLVAMAVLFVLGLLAAGFLNRNAIVRPINSLVSAARAVGAGDLNARVDVATGGDELSELGVTFNSMVEQLRESERALEERVAQRTRELQAILDTSMSLSSTLELQPLLEDILNHLQRLVDCDGAAVLLVDGEMLVQLAARRPSSPGAVDAATDVRPVQSSSSEIWKMIKSGRPVMIDDVRGETAMAVAYRTQVGADLDRTPMAYVRSWTAVPLVARDSVTGMLAMASAEAGAFDDRDIELASAVASQAAIAIENARLYEKTRGQSRETEALLSVSQRISSELSLADLVETILHISAELFASTRATITAIDETGTATLLGSSNETLSAVGVHPGFQYPMTDFGVLWEELRAGYGVIIDDVMDDSPFAIAYRGATRPEAPELYRDFRSWMAVPMMIQDRAIGWFVVTHAEPGRYNAKDLRVASGIASQAAVAVENATLFEAARRQARDMEALSRADAELFQTLNLDRVLQSLVDVAVDVLGVDKSVVMLHEGEVDVIRAYRNFTAVNIATFNKVLSTMPHEEPPPETQRPIVYANIADAPAFIAEMLGKEDVTSHLSVPVRDTERTLGVFGVSFREEHVFTDEEQRLYSALADRAAVAIKNAELYERAQQAASLEERQRLARELHDSVSQALYGIALGTRTARMRLGDDPHNAAEPVDYVMSLAQAGLAEMRALIFELRPESLEQEGLVAAIEKQVASTEARYKLNVETDLGDEPACALEVKEALYRIAQEALHNVVKHAHAQRVDVRLEQEGDSLVLTVRDNGRGFDTGASFPGHVGLHSMPERASKLGGNVTVESAPDTGTTVTARLPI